MHTIDTKKVEQIRDEESDATIINVLGQASFAQAHIPGSINIPVDEEDFLERVKLEVGGKDDPVVVYCADEECPASQKAAEKLENAGYQQVYDYAGGIAAWQDAGNRVASA